MRRLRRILLHNWHLKLLALAIAFLLWAAYTAEPVAETGYLVPLEFRNIPAGLELSDDVPAQIHVRVRGRSAILRRLSAADLSVAVDLAGAEPGEMLVRLGANNAELPPGVELARLAPSEFRVRLIARATSP
jgi:YbbR domain-containing protein